MIDTNESNMTDKNQFFKCGRCRCWRKEEEFYNSKGRRIKTCNCCRILSKRYRDKKRAQKQELKIKMDDGCGDNNRINLLKLPNTTLQSEEL